MNQLMTTHDTVLINGATESAQKLPPIPGDTPVVYEVIRLMSGIPLFVEAHLERLNQSFHIAGFPATLDAASVKRAIHKLAKVCAVEDQNLRINAWRRGDSIFWEGFFVESRYPDPSVYKTGVETGLLRMERHHPNAKIWQGELKDIVAVQCEKRSLYEMILVDSEGFLSEGSRSNLFFTQGNTLITAPDRKVLGGITRQMLLELIAQNGIPLIKRDISELQLEDFDGAFITGTSIHLLPVSQIDCWQRPSSEQPMIRNLMEQFEALVSAYKSAYHADYLKEGLEWNA